MTENFRQKQISMTESKSKKQFVEHHQIQTDLKLNEPNTATEKTDKEILLADQKSPIRSEKNDNENETLVKGGILSQGYNILHSKIIQQ